MKPSPIHQLPVLLFGLLLPFLGIGQATLANDEIEGAIELALGERVNNVSNRTATLSKVLPEKYPATCVQTFENDMWYKFHTVDGKRFYKVFLTYSDCNTPAGMQGVLLEKDSTGSGEFIYRECVNNRNMDTLQLLLSESKGGKEIFIYLDGFDGTICTFDLWIEGYDSVKIAKNDYRHHRFVYNVKTLPKFDPHEYQGDFVNNAFTLNWTMESGEDVDYFLVERVHSYELNGPNYSRVLAVVEPKASVTGEATDYEYTDFTAAHRNGVTYCYRIVKVDGTGKKFYGTLICKEASVAESFYVNEVQYSKKKQGAFNIHYINYKKNQNFTVELLDIERNVLKSLELKKEPIRDGDITLDMSEYNPGIYLVRMGNGKDFFLRSFEKTTPATPAAGPPDQ